MQRPLTPVSVEYATPTFLFYPRRSLTSSTHIHALRTHFPLPTGPTLSQHPLCSLSSGMRKSPDVSPRRLSDISPQLRQLKYLVVDEAIKEDLKSSRSVEDINSASIEERILRITGYYGYQPWSASYKSELHLELLHFSSCHEWRGLCSGQRGQVAQI